MVKEKNKLLYEPTGGSGGGPPKVETVDTSSRKFRIRFKLVDSNIFSTDTQVFFTVGSINDAKGIIDNINNRARKHPEHEGHPGHETCKSFVNRTLGSFAANVSVNNDSWNNKHIISRFERASSLLATRIVEHEGGMLIHGRQLIDVNGAYWNNDTSI